MSERTKEQIIQEVASIAFADSPGGPKTADKLRALDILAGWLEEDARAKRGVILVDAPGPSCAEGLEAPGLHAETKADTGSMAAGRVPPGVWCPI